MCRPGWLFWRAGRSLPPPRLWLWLGLRPLELHQWSTRTADASSTSGLGTVINGVTKSSGETFSATYHIVNPGAKENVSITFAQSQGKEAVITSEGSFYITSSSVTACTGPGNKTCTKLPSSLMAASLASVNAVKELFSPGVILSNLKGIKGIMATHPQGYSASTSSETFRSPGVDLHPPQRAKAGVAGYVLRGQLFRGARPRPDQWQ